MQPPNPPCQGGGGRSGSHFHGSRLKIACAIPLNAVIAHIAQTAGSGLSGSRDFTLPIAAESPAAAGDFELITRLIIMDSGEAGR